MSVTVRLVGPLRGLAGNLSSVQLDGCGTVGEALHALIGRHEALGPRLVTAEGALHHFVRAYVNSAEVPAQAALDAPLSDGDQLTFIPAVSGG